MYFEFVFRLEVLRQNIRKERETYLDSLPIENAPG